MLVGITGPSGAGKGCVTRIFAERGFRIIDADLTAREVVMPGQPALEALAEAFGSDIIKSDGSLDRRLLAQKAFSTAENTDTLNEIMTGVICSRMKLLADECAKNGINCVFDAPRLIESGLINMCDTCVAVTAPREVRIARLKLRDGLTEQEILTRLSRQHEDEYYTSKCEYTVINDGDLSKLKEQAELIADKIVS